MAQLAGAGFPKKKKGKCAQVTAFVSKWAFKHETNPHNLISGGCGSEIMLKGGEIWI